MRIGGHLSSATLFELLAQAHTELPSAALKHLRECARCSGDLADLRLLAASVPDTRTEPSSEALARAYALLEPKLPRRSEVKGFTLARLVHDSGSFPAILSVRAPMGSRQQIWRTPEVDVDLQLEGPGLGSPAELLGQVLPRGRRRLPSSQGRVWLLEAGRDIASSGVTQSGEFALPAPRSRRWRIWLAWGPLRLRVESRS